MDNNPNPQNRRSVDDEPILDHEYDGIQEADNPLPKWWVNGFLISIVFAIIYLPVVHVMDILPRGELTRNVALAKAQADMREAELLASGALDKDPVAAGKKYFGIFCVTCHGTHAEGGIGPNLTDNFWLHGPKTADIIHTITNGVSAKGMPTWGPILGDRKIKMIATYVSTLYLSKPPVAGKKAEGQAFDMAVIRAEEAAPADTTKKAAVADTTAKPSAPEKKKV
jgi:cytochrome c oxidase cbb3-type subunit III